MIFPFFCVAGNVLPHSKYLFKILLKQGEIIVANALKNLIGILSGPGALCGLSYRICTRTSSQ